MSAFDAPESHRELVARLDAESKLPPAHPRQHFFDAVLRALKLHAPELAAATKIAIATDAALFGETKGPG